MSKEEPTGGGMYLRIINESQYGTPKQAATIASKNKLSFVAIPVIWQEYNRTKRDNSPETVLRYANAFYDAGVDVWLWGFPQAGHEDEYVATFAGYTAVCDGLISGWLYDPEVWYKWKHKNARFAPANMRGTKEYSANLNPAPGNEAFYRERAAELMRLTIDSMHEGLGLGVTSYGYSWFHKNFPWEQFGGYGYGSPQLYGAQKDDIDKSIAAYQALGWKHILPSTPTFGISSGAALDAHMSDFASNPAVKGFIAWSWPQTSAIEWKILAKWAEYFSKGK